MIRIGQKSLTFMEQSAGIGINWTSWTTTFPESLVSAIQSMVKKKNPLSVLLICLQLA